MRQPDFDRIKSGFSYEERISGVGGYFQASVLVPLVSIDGIYRLLFEQRAPQIRQGGEICFPGGEIDASDDSPMATALRETHEEIGCDPDLIEMIGRLDTLLLPSGALVHAYLGILPGLPHTETIAETEVASVFTVPLSHFLEQEPEVYNCKVLIHPYLTDKETGKKQVLLPTEELGLPAYYSEPWGGADHQIYVYRTEHGIVWGLTARIIYDCVQKIKEIEAKEAE